MISVLRALAVGTLVAVAACGGTGSTSAPDTADATISAAAEHFGLGPSSDAEVTYQPDVVILDDGPAAVRAASADGLVWAIDKSTSGADELDVGKVLYATSLAVGRIVHLEPDGNDLVVVLAPVSLGEVIRDGHVRISQDLDLDTLHLRGVPDEPGAVTTSVVPQAAGHAVRFDAPEGRAPIEWLHSELPPPINEGSTSWTANDWSGTVARESGDIVVHVDHLGEGLKADIDMGFHFVKPHLDADVGIVDGEVGDAQLELRGLREVTLDIAAGSVGGLADNLSQKIEIPVSLDAPVIVGGVAMNLNVRFRFIAQTAFTAQNSTLHASGDWVTDGPLFYDRASGRVDIGMPTITPKTNILDSLDGISVGVNGFVFTTEIRVMLGLGTPAASAGPYARVVTSVGLTVGSDIGIGGPANKCRQTSVTFTGAAGAALVIAEDTTNAINTVFDLLGITQRVEPDATKEIANETLYSQAFWSPDVDYCRMG